VISVPPANAATVTATGNDASYCNQTVDVNTGVTAERLANGDCVVKFSTASTNISWTVPTGVTSVNLLVVAGGGGGGSRHAGGGGAGGILHVTNYSVTPSKIHYTEEVNASIPVVNCSYFITNIIALQDCFIWKKKKQAFTVFMCTNGQFEMVVNGEILRYRMGDTILIPAIIEHLTLKGKATLLEISI
jgi:hypothetical protein